MLNEAIYTIEEVSRYLKVPVEAIRKEIASGRLHAMNVGGFIRIGEFALADYKNLATKEVDLTESAPSAQDEWLRLQPAPDFVHKWPDGKVEQFLRAQNGTATYTGREYHVALGFTVRKSAGRLRRRCLVIVDRYPTVEFVKAEDEESVGPMASIIKDRTGKQIPSNASAPSEYEGIPVGGYREVVDGPGAPNGLAVLCSSDDFKVMVKHALIRFRFREERA